MKKTLLALAAVLALTACGASNISKPGTYICSSMRLNWESANNKGWADRDSSYLVNSKLVVTQQTIELKYDIAGLHQGTSDVKFKLENGVMVGETRTEEMLVDPTNNTPWIKKRHQIIAVNPDTHQIRTMLVEEGFTIKGKKTGQTSWTVTGTCGK